MYKTNNIIYGENNTTTIYHTNYTIIWPLKQLKYNCFTWQHTAQMKFSASEKPAKYLNAAIYPRLTFNKPTQIINIFKLAATQHCNTKSKNKLHWTTHEYVRPTLSINQTHKWIVTDLNLTIKYYWHTQHQHIQTKSLILIK